jgi:glycosyltransferase involved in cell wall biosynthesis
MGFRGRLAIQQRVAPDYRRGLFDRLARASGGGASVFAGKPMPGEGIVSAEDLGAAEWVRARNRYFLRGAFYLCWQDGIARWLSGFDPDVLVIEANPRELSNRIAIRWMKQRGRPVLAWGLGAAAARGPLAPIRVALRRVALRGVAGAIAYSRRGQREFEALGLPPASLFVAPNAMMPRPAPVSPDSLARRGAHGRPPRLLFVGRLQPRKRVDLLIEASAAQPGPVELWIVGDGPARSELEALARRVLPTTKFHGDLRGAALNEVFDQADLFVLPGTGGLAVQQALGHGLPVIVASGDGTQEDIVTPENGWLIPDADAVSLTRILTHAVSDRGRLSRMGRASWQMAQDRFNLEAMADAFLTAVSAVAGEAT